VETKKGKKEESKIKEKGREFVKIKNGIKAEQEG
jgi:hypothetical protein